MPDHSTAFPPDFLWGAATSAYQIEGSPLADGAGPSIWHEFAHTPGRTRDGDTGDLACDHYRRYRDDVALMGGLGLNAYRFSVSWSRVLPEDAAGSTPRIGFHQRLVDALLEQGIQPMLTLYHWDLPAALDRRGGWLNPDSAGWFADYAQILSGAGRPGPAGVTLNEPWVVVDGGYLHGVLAPGLRNPFAAPHAAQTCCGRMPPPCKPISGCRSAPDRPGGQPGTEISGDETAETWRRPCGPTPTGTASIRSGVSGSYPPELAGSSAPPGRHSPPPISMPCASRRIFSASTTTAGRWCGTTSRLAAGRRPSPAGAADPHRSGLGSLSARSDRHPAMGCRPLRAVAALHHRKRRGFLRSAPGRRRGGRPLRRRYLRDHLRAALAALAAGVDLRGYFAWSLLDNFEGAWLFAALRSGSRRLCHPAAHRQNQRKVVCGDCPRLVRDVVRQRDRGDLSGQRTCAAASRVIRCLTSQLVRQNVRNRMTRESR